MIRSFHIAVLIALSICMVSCPAPEEKSLWNDIKINDLAPETGNGIQTNRQLQTINFDLHIYEIPADNINKINEIRRTLDIRPLRFNSRLAFSANDFSVYYGRLQEWNTISDLLIEAGGERRSRTTLLLPDGQSEDITITGFDYPRTIYYVSSQGLNKEGANIGPGLLVMRIKAGDSSSLNNAANVTIYPVFKVPVGSTIPQFDAMQKTREFPFTAAAFGLYISPGDFIILSPEEIAVDPSTLGSLFFSNLKGSMFFQKDKRKPPAIKPSFIVYMLTCTAINN
jgi:hypothetical protein